TKTAPDYYNVEGQQYIDMRLGHVESSGGELNVDIDDLDDPGSRRTIELAAKGSALTYADGSGADDSTINWQSRNLVLMGAATAPPSDEPQQITVRYAQFHSFTDVLGREWDLQNAEGLKEYNDYLIEKIGNGEMVPVDGSGNPLAEPTIAD